MNQMSLDLQPEPEYRNRDLRIPRASVWWRKDNQRWTACVYFQGKRKRLGLFSSKEEAKLACVPVVAEMTPAPDPAVEEAIRLVELDPAVRCIRLTQGQFTKIDADDYDRVARWKWCAMWDPKASVFPLAWSISTPSGASIRNNRRKVNLRPASHAQNCRNRGIKSDNSSTHLASRASIGSRRQESGALESASMVSGFSSAISMS